MQSDGDASGLILEHGVFVVDGVDLRGANRAFGAPREPTVMGTDSVLVQQLLDRRQTPLGEADVKTATRPSRTSGLSAGAIVGVTCCCAMAASGLLIWVYMNKMAHRTRGVTRASIQMLPEAGAEAGAEAGQTLESETDDKSTKYVV